MKHRLHLILLVVMTTSLFLPAARGTQSTSQFKNFAMQAERGEGINVVFFGGSLTWGSQATDPMTTSYRALIGHKLQEAYPKAHFRFWDSAIGGTGSKLGTFRLERDVMAHKPDLVFLEFTVNDGPCSKPDPNLLASYESLVRRMVLAGVPVVQMILPTKADVQPNPPQRPLDALHKEIGKAYGLAVADVVASVKAHVEAGKATPDQLWDAYPDTTHPGDAGYALYAEAGWQALQNAISKGQECRAPEKMLNADTYMKVNRFKLASLEKLPRGWTVTNPQRTAWAFDFVPSRWLDSVVMASRKKDQADSPEPLVLNVRGRSLLLFGEATPASGKYHVLVDGKEVKAADIGAIAKNGNWRYVESLVDNLEPDKTHRVEILPELQPGQEFRMESLCVAGGECSVTPL